jgi:predicted RecB family nuclease
MLYNFVQCPHRVSMDLFGDPADKDPVSAFVQLLWDKGNEYERVVIENLEVPFTDLGTLSTLRREIETIEAMRRGDDLIYSGRITAGDLVGEPDLLRKQGCGYVAGDIKSGAGEEGATEEDDGKPKKHYAVQLALYTDILEKLDLSGGRTPFVWDIKGEEVIYDLNLLQGSRNPQTLWSFYKDVLYQVSSIASGHNKTLPANGATCKLCHWRSLCLDAVIKTQDLTLIPELGRSKRDSMALYIRNLPELAAVDIDSLIKGSKTIIPGIGPETLAKFQARARLQMDADSGPYLIEPVRFPISDVEIFFDVETDPMRDICYLHGFVERDNVENGKETYIAFFANEPTPAAEEKAFAAAWKYIGIVSPCAIYYYSKYERAIWRKLREKYPNVITEKELEDLFSNNQSIDLYYDVIKPKTEWPTRDYSIKTLAGYLGFKWRDTDPSGASSIEWYHRWTETKDKDIRKRILEYNEDDCIATRVLLDGIKGMRVKR